MNTDTLYEQSVFGEWLKTLPPNVKHTFKDYDVDMNGERVAITFYIDDEEATQ